MICSLIELFPLKIRLIGIYLTFSLSINKHKLFLKLENFQLRIMLKINYLLYIVKLSLILKLFALFSSAIYDITHFKMCLYFDKSLNKNYIISLELKRNHTFQMSQI